MNIVESTTHRDKLRSQLRVIQGGKAPSSSTLSAQTLHSDPFLRSHYLGTSTETKNGPTVPGKIWDREGWNDAG